MNLWKLLSAAFAAVAPRHGASGRHHRRPENPRRRSPPDRQPPHPPRRHRRAGRRSALPQHQRRALDLRRRRARRTDQALRRQELDLSYQGRHRPPRPHRGALRGRRRGHPEMAGVERLGAGADAGLARLRGATRRPRARPRPGCGRARSSRRGTGASATRRPPFSAPSSRRRMPRRSCWHRHRDRVAPSPDCTIKGNVNRSGECIFHQPTSRWYAKIEMKISKGTRWFCSVEEAEAAGCRETRR